MYGIHVIRKNLRRKQLNSSLFQKTIIRVEPELVFRSSEKLFAGGFVLGVCVSIIQPEDEIFKRLDGGEQLKPLGFRFRYIIIFACVAVFSFSIARCICVSTSANERVRGIFSDSRSLGSDNSVVLNLSIFVL